MLRTAKKQGKRNPVYIPETRPTLQGSRLTAFELARDGFECKLLTDTAVGHIMARGMVNKVIVGADRIMRDGHIFNKIGTSQLAIIAKNFKIPFIAAAPSSSFDLRSDRMEIEIEEREPAEVTMIRGRRVAAKGVPILNPAFDMTPPQLVTAIVSERGVAKPPYGTSIKALFKR
ncbi:MAG: S-methyl-5-thioribose-1-phosphate isomerase [Nitrososphaerales archaeon]